MILLREGRASATFQPFCRTTALGLRAPTETCLVSHASTTVNASDRFIRRALVKARGNQAQAARMLRLRPTTLNHKMKAYRINSGRKEAACMDDVVTEGCPESQARRQAAT